MDVNSTQKAPPRWALNFFTIWFGQSFSILGSQIVHLPDLPAHRQDRSATVRFAPSQGSFRRCRLPPGWRSGDHAAASP
jgi:hypothetical protein